MPKPASEVPDYIWDCRNIDVPHSPNLTHEEGIEDGLPNYHAQQKGDVRVTICSKCHPRIPGHIVNVIPENIEQYFTIKDGTELMEQLPSGISGSGASQNVRERILHYCIQDFYNPMRGHAGKTLKISLGYQLDRPEWQPDESDLSDQNEDLAEKYWDAYR